MVFLKLFVLLVLGIYFDIVGYLILWIIISISIHVIECIPRVIYEKLISKTFDITQYKDTIHDDDISDFIDEHYKLFTKPSKVGKLLNEEYSIKGFTCPWTNW